MNREGRQLEDIMSACSLGGGSSRCSATFGPDPGVEKKLELQFRVLSRGGRYFRNCCIRTIPLQEASH